MANPFQSPEFKKLFKEWNDKLEKDGFVDAEDFSLPRPALKAWHNLKFKGLTQEEIKESEQYYEMALQVLRYCEFENETFRVIWELHTKGQSIREIVKVINLKGFGRDRVCVFIQRIQGENGLRKR